MFLIIFIILYLIYDLIIYNNEKQLYNVIILKTNYNHICIIKSEYKYNILIIIIDKQYNIKYYIKNQTLTINHKKYIIDVDIYKFLNIKSIYITKKQAQDLVNIYCKRCKDCTFNIVIYYVYIYYKLYLYKHVFYKPVYKYPTNYIIQKLIIF